MLMAHELGGEAIEHIRSELSYGRFLSSNLASLPLESGRVIAILPASVPSAALTDFQSGDVASGEEVHKLADLIERYISRHMARVCVFEHPVLRVGDSRKPSVEYFTVGEDVYVFLWKQSAREAIIRAARETHGYPSIGVLSSVSEGAAIPSPASSQAESLLDELAGHVDAVMVGAYDNESWIVWLSERFQAELGDTTRLFGEGSGEP